MNKKKKETRGRKQGKYYVSNDELVKGVREYYRDEKFTEEYYINPVCGVPVSKKSPKHIIDYQGEKVYFCCDGCKVSFEKNPSQYIAEKL